MIYRPAEDSFLLSSTLKNYLKEKKKNIKILDMGSGSGIQAKTCIKKGFKNILTADINLEVINYLRKQKLHTIQSDLFSNIKINKKFDLIIFNAPYLPLDEREPEDSRLATTAGKKGYEVIVRFLEEAKVHLSKEGSILLLYSSLSKPNIIKKYAKKLGYKQNLISNLKIDFEELFVYEFRIE